MDSETEEMICQEKGQGKKKDKLLSFKLYIR